METNLSLVTGDVRLKELKFGSVWVHISSINRGSNILGDGWDIFTKKDSVLFWLERGKKQGRNKAGKERGWLGKVLPSGGTDVQIERQRRSNSGGRKRDGAGKKRQDEKTTTLIRVYCPLAPLCFILSLLFPPRCCWRWGLDRINSVLSHERNVSFLQ